MLATANAFAGNLLVITPVHLNFFCLLSVLGKELGCKETKTGRRKKV
jgi:hypothetical protein